VTGIAISLCGEYDYVNEEVVRCFAYPFLVGKLRDNLKERFGCGNVWIVNDGDAHALALKSYYKQRGKSSASAISLSLGTGVGFGILDWKGELLHMCRGHDWDVGSWQCDTRASNKTLYWALGSQGLMELEEK
jgi:predicted NBD/HSP70 family sugar kinase